MDTKEKNRESRPKQPSAQQTQVRRKTAPSNSRSNQAEAARAARVKAMRREAEEKNRFQRKKATRVEKLKTMRKEVEKKPVPKHRTVSKPKRPMQPVVYTEPKAFNRSRLIIQLISIMAIVMALILGLSIFFKVEKITVSGAEAYSAWTVREASGIQEGDNLMTFSRARAAARIEAELPYVYKARIGIKLPDTVNIVIEEIDVVYAIQCQDNIWWLITSEGEVMEQTDSAAASNYTQVWGVKLNNPIVGEQAHAFENVVVSAAPEDGTEESAAETAAPLAVTGQQRLLAAMEILQALEQNDIVGEVASVDVEDLTMIELWYGTRYQVNLGDTTDIDYKIACMNYAIAELSEYEAGALDVSFIIWEDKVGYTPFE